MTLSQATPTAYTVRDYYGNTVSSGAVSGSTVLPAAPVGGWDPGWYRMYLTGANTDTVFGPSYGAVSFIVIRDNANLHANPALTVPDIGAGQGGGEAKDMILKGVLGIGTSRVQIGDASSPATGADNLATAHLDATFSDTYWPVGGDSVRGPRYRFLQFPNRTFDRVDINAGQFARVYKKDATIVGANCYIELTGSAGAWTMNVYYPNNSTLVETFGPVANGTALQTATATSAYVRAFNAGSSGVATSKTAIGDVYYNGVVTAVADLYPYGYTRFEGPSNEPVMRAETAHDMKLFQSAVHAGNASAKAVGPCPVDITALTGTQSWTAYLDAGGAAYCDEWTFHAYNSQTNGDINLGRHTIEAFLALLTSYGVNDRPMWQTESTHVFTSVFADHHPRRSRVPLLQTLLFEQYGLPRERNLVWYDRSHGFNSYPAWVLANSSPAPYAALYRVLAEETFGMTHYQRLDFGCEAANRVFLGSLYVSSTSAPAASCLVLVAQSYMPGMTIDLTIAGSSSPITYSDGFGNTATATVSSGRVTIPVSETPTYVRLPTGVTATVYQISDWGTSVPPSISSYGTGSFAELNDDQWQTQYIGTTGGGVHISANSLPETAQIMFLANATFQRVLIFCGIAWQHQSALTTFTVDTWNGSSWTTQNTVDVSAGCTSFRHATDSTDIGTTIETYWPEQWIFDVKFPSPVTCSGVRVNASATSYGGEPDALAISVGGQGDAGQHLTLQEMMVLSTDTPGF